MEQIICIITSTIIISIFLFIHGRSTDRHLIDILYELKQNNKSDNHSYYESELETQMLIRKFFHFLNEKEKRDRTIIDKMDWPVTSKEFMIYLKNDRV